MFRSIPKHFLTFYVLPTAKNERERAHTTIKLNRCSKDIEATLLLPIKEEYIAK